MAAKARSHKRWSCACSRLKAIGRLPVQTPDYRGLYVLRMSQLSDCFLLLASQTYAEQAGRQHQKHTRFGYGECAFNHVIGAGKAPNAARFHRHPEDSYRRGQL